MTFSVLFWTPCVKAVLSKWNNASENTGSQVAFLSAEKKGAGGAVFFMAIQFQIFKSRSSGSKLRIRVPNGFDHWCAQAPNPGLTAGRDLN